MIVTFADERLEAFIKDKKKAGNKHQDTVISSIRIMGGWVERLIFEELESGIKVLVLELNNKHYGNKK
jgi:hypothetical protein